jgi:hypothetical protein
MEKDTTAHPIPKKKRGPVKRLPPMIDTHIYLEPDLVEWAKRQEGGLAGLVRRLLQQERDRLAAAP